MAMKSNISALFFLLLLSCAGNGILTEVCELPKKLKEVSAIEVTEKSNRIWALQDSGNKAELYALDKKGKITHTLLLTSVTNTDWEGLASDKAGNLYVGDFGNNDNDRKDLGIYKVNAADLTKTETAIAAKTTFYFPEQKEFPPKKANRIFDVEAFFISNGNFYLFTKNRSSKFDGTTILYSVPNKPGNHAATRIGSYQTCSNFNRCAITGADISPDGKKVALLGSDTVWLFENFKGNAIFGVKPTVIDLKHYSQKEGICFISDTVLYIADERDKKSGGFVYRLDLKSLKSKS